MTALSALAPSPIARGTARVRPFNEADIAEVARLHARVWPQARPVALDAYRAYFTRVFLEHGAPSGRPLSLVCEENGQIAGFIGIVPRRLVLGGATFQAAVSSQFIVDPGSRVGLVALKLSKAFVEGPQDLSIADEGNDVSRRIWEGLGGTTALLYSLYWTRPIRPAGLALRSLRRRRGFRALATVGRPFGAVADMLVTRVPASYFRPPEPASSIDDLETETIIHLAPAFADALRVDYDVGTFDWLLNRLQQRVRRVLAATVRKAGSVVGWYISHITDDGLAEVVHLAAAPSSVHDVLDQLVYQAWKAGAVAATGRLDPRFMQALSDKYGLFHRRGPWVLVKGQPELVQAFLNGDAWFSPFDGEWSLRF